jgi:hypothetical protein
MITSVKDISRPIFDGIFKANFRISAENLEGALEQFRGIQEGLEG